MIGRRFFLGAAFAALSFASVDAKTNSSGPSTRGFSYDYIANNYSELSTILGDDVTYPKAGKVLYVANDCAGAAITITSKTWTSFTVRGTSVGQKPIMPRIILNAVVGGITWQWLDFYNVYVGSPGSPVASGQVTFETSTSDSHTFYECVTRDNDLSTKTMGVNIDCYRGIAVSGGGRCNNLTIYGSDIRNSNRALSISGNNILVTRCTLRDFYQNAIVNNGNNHTITFNTMYNMWAAASDSGSPHGSVGPASPQPSAGVNMGDHLIKGNVCFPGTARFNYDGQYPAASGVKYNDAFSNSMRYYNITICLNTIIVNDTQAIEIDSGDDCYVGFNTLASDESQNLSTTPNLYLNDPANITVVGNVIGSVSFGAQGRGSGVVAMHNSYARPDKTGSTNLLAYANFFNGTTAMVANRADALSAYALDASNPAASWTYVPGAIGPYFNYTTFEGDVPTVNAPSPTGTGTQAASSVTKPQDCWLRATTGGGAWHPTNERRGIVIFKGSNDASVDADGRTLFQFGSSRCSMIRLNAGNWRFSVDNASATDILQVDSTVETDSSDGDITFALAWDSTTARVELYFSIGGILYPDIPNVATFVNEDNDIAGSSAFTLGADQVTTPSTNAWIGTQDTFLMDDRSVDLDTDAGLSEVFNSSNELKDMSTDGAGYAIYWYGDAALYNSGGANLGDGLGNGGSPMTFVKGGASSYS